jgi:hypothetical protein
LIGLIDHGTLHYREDTPGELKVIDHYDPKDPDDFYDILLYLWLMLTALIIIGYVFSVLIKITT